MTRYELSDMVRAHQELKELRQGRGIGLVIAALLAVLAFHVVQASLDGDAASALPVAVPMLVVLGGLAWGARLATPAERGKRAYAALQEWQRQVRFEFSGEGLRHRNERSAAELEWSLIEGWRETEDAFYVQQAALQFLIVPKRAFETADEIATVRSLLERCVRPVEATAKRSTRRGPIALVLMWLCLIAALVVIYAVVTRS